MIKNRVLGLLNYWTILVCKRWYFLDLLISMLNLRQSPTETTPMYTIRDDSITRAARKDGMFHCALNRYSRPITN